MHTNDTNNTNMGEVTGRHTEGKLIYPELSYLLTGIFFATHNELGRFCRERQYGDSLERRLRELKVPYSREYRIGESGNQVDFIIDDKIIVEIKAKRLLVKEDYYQLQRYLQSLQKRLGLLVNFQNQFLKPLRIVRIDTDARFKFV